MGAPQKIPASSGQEGIQCYSTADDPAGGWRRQGPPGILNPDLHWSFRLRGSPIGQSLAAATETSSMSEALSCRSPRLGRLATLLLTALVGLGLSPDQAHAGWAGPLQEGEATLEDVTSGVEDAVEELQDTAGNTAADIDAEASAVAASAEEPADDGMADWERSLNEAFGEANGALESVVFYPIPFGKKPDVVNDDGSVTPGKKLEVPFAVIWLIIGATFFTLRMGFINLRGFVHAIKVVSGKYSNPNDAGEVSHFQALSAALSATVGLGNIAGVAIAISLGGPGATFWMIMAGLLGMSSKFTECTLGQKYREVREDGQVMGGAMYYLSKGLAERGFRGLGGALAALFAVLCIGGSVAGGNSFQVNQSLGAIGRTIPFFDQNKWVYGAIMTVMAAMVIIGGIKRIASVASKIVPTMCFVYVTMAVVILVMKAGEIPSAFGLIFNGAFNPDAAFGGFVGVLVVGFQRAAFSNEAGVGSAAIAHSAAKTEYPVREGIVALLEPFIDTVLVCTMTALVIVITGAYDNPDPEFVALREAKNGAGLTSEAMGSVVWFFPYILAVAVALFAFSTMISWFYYGERCWSYLFSENTNMVYKLFFLSFTFLGAVLTGTNMLAFGDTMIMAMCIPNILGIYFLATGVRDDLEEYWKKYKNDEFKTFN